MEDDRRHFLVTLTKLIGSLGITAFFFPFLQSWRPIIRPAPTQTKVDLRPLVPRSLRCGIINLFGLFAAHKPC